jgi:hypothetical protein
MMQAGLGPDMMGMDGSGMMMGPGADCVLWGAAWLLWMASA